jgi:hypothetical protein
MSCMDGSSDCKCHWAEIDDAQTASLLVGCLPKQACISVIFQE